MKELSVFALERGHPRVVLGHLGVTPGRPGVRKRGCTRRKGGQSSGRATKKATARLNERIFQHSLLLIDVWVVQVPRFPHDRPGMEKLH
jgi:hypothetical protein